MLIARQSTARTVTVGPVLDADGVAVTGLAVSAFKGSVNGGAPAALNGSATLTHRHTGHYSLALTATDLATIGTFEVVLDSTTNACAPKEITVLDEAVWDVLFGTTAPSTHTAAAVQTLVAAGAVASVTGNVGGNVVGSVGSVTGAVGSVTGNVGGNVVGSVASVTGNVGGNVVGSVGSLVGHTVQTGDSFARLGAPAGASVSADVAAVKADTAAVLLDTGTDGVVVAAASKSGYALTPTTGLGNQTANITGNLSGSVGSVTGAVGSVTGNVGGNVAGEVGSVGTGGITADSIAANAFTNDKFHINTGLKPIVSSTSQTGSTSTTLILNAGDSAPDDFYNGQVIRLTLLGDARLITDYVSSTKTATVTPAWASGVSGNVTYAILAAGPVGQAQSVADPVSLADYYHAEIHFTRDQSNTQDEWTVTFFKNGVRSTTGITSPTIQLVNRSDGTDLKGATAVTQIGSSGSYKIDLTTTERVTVGEAVLAIVAWTQDAGSRSFSRLISRDST